MSVFTRLLLTASLAGTGTSAGSRHAASGRPLRAVTLVATAPGLHDRGAVAPGPHAALRAGHAPLAPLRLPSVASAPGQLLMWGGNDQGQLGTGTLAYSNHPVAVPGLRDAVSVSACSWSSVAADAAGAVWYWGLGQLRPHRQDGLSNVVEIAVGRFDVARKRDGSVWVWVPTTPAMQNDPLALRQIPVPHPVRALAAGCSSGGGLLALANDGTVWTWGVIYPTGPVQEVIGLGHVVSVAIGDGQRLAVKSDGTLWAWGTNDGGADLGLGPVTPDSGYPTPQRLPNLPPMASVVAYDRRSAAVSRDGRVWEWGDVAGSSTATVNRPRLVAGLRHVVAVALGQDHSLALESDGTIWAWGLNIEGQLGVRTVSDRSFVPVHIPRVQHVLAIAAGDTQSAAIQGTSHPR